MSSDAYWRRCSACKEPIAFGAQYWVCNVSTCNRKRTGLVFCTVSCWEVHLPGANHRESWALDRVAPASATHARAEAEAPRRRVVGSAGGGTRGAPSSGDDVLIVASRLKDYVRRKSGFHTSDRVLAPLSDIVRRVVNEAIRHARSEGRRTLLDRDVPEDR